MKDSSNYIQVLISSPSRDEANQLSDLLVSKRLVAGCLILDGSSRYWWDEQIVEKQYWNIQAFSLAKNKERIIETVESAASDECPIVAFFELDGNGKFLNWISQSVHVE